MGVTHCGINKTKKKKTEKIRLCIDMRLPNTAVQRERHISPTVDDIVHDLNGATMFSKLDLNAGYHQLELAPESRYITTFSTHIGLRRYTRLIFGISSAAEVFQHAIQNVLHGIQGVRNFSDDIIVFGTTPAEHDRSLEEVFKRLHDHNLTINRDKCEFHKTSLEFYGYVFSKDGISADPKKIQAITHMSLPQNPSEVRSLLGLVNYSARFIPDFSSITQPLRELTKKEIEWSWKVEHTEALNQLMKDRLVSNPVMSYFHPERKTNVIMDASPVGLGAILAQTDKVENKTYIVAYASRALTPVEQRYSQTD